MKYVLSILLIFEGSVSAASDKIDLQKLEQQYWSSKDDEFTVVQNRSYTKKGRYFFNVAAGIPINDPYSKGTLQSLSSGYFFSEQLGVELNYEKAQLTNNEATDQFIKDHGTVPNHNIFSESKSLNLIFVPIYAKMSLLDKKIVYFDMSISLGLGTLDYEVVKSTGNNILSATEYNIDIAQHFFFSENFAFRIDFKNKFSNQERYRYKINTTETESSRYIDTKSANDTNFIFGLTYWH